MPPPVNKSPAASRYLEAAQGLTTTFDRPAVMPLGRWRAIIVVGSASRFLENALASPLLDPLSPPAGKLCPGFTERRAPT
jgi:hypothetical protein